MEWVISSFIVLLIMWIGVSFVEVLGNPIHYSMRFSDLSLVEKMAYITFNIVIYALILACIGMFFGMLVYVTHFIIFG